MMTPAPAPDPLPPPPPPPPALSTALPPLTGSRRTAAARKVPA